MPIRDVDTYGVPRANVRVVANRGVNGIDGSISTALGMAMAGVPTTALIGDVSALHDATALSEVARLGAPLRIIVVNNDGGGIFSFLPQRRSGVIADEMYEKHWGTPHGLSLVAVARSMGLEATNIDNMADLEEVAGSPIQPELIEVTTDRDENVEVHRAIIAAVREALAVR
jgi:2-succinyl-5-enolpyruvyl-6-hydroxy-3-cyclohexene-1-carboxylate synthase